MGCTLVLRIRQAHDLEHLANVFLRHAAHRLHNAQIFLAGKMAVIARAFNETATCLRIASRLRRIIGSPNTAMSPAVGRTSPRIIFNVVDLPAPFGPRKP